VCVFSAACEELWTGVVTVVVCAFFDVLGGCGLSYVKDCLFVWVCAPFELLSWGLGPFSEGFAEPDVGHDV
jgi:hypothetical protein